MTIFFEPASRSKKYPMNRNPRNPLCAAFRSDMFPRMSRGRNIFASAAVTPLPATMTCFLEADMVVVSVSVVLYRAVLDRGPHCQVQKK